MSNADTDMEDLTYRPILAAEVRSGSAPVLSGSMGSEHEYKYQFHDELVGHF